MITPRIAELKDLSSITEIYNEAILTTTATFDTEPKSIGERKSWFESHDKSHPVIVAEIDGVIAGWGCLSKWSERAAYSKTVENSLYVKAEHRGKGIGKAILHELIRIAEHNNFHTIIARIADGNSISVKMHADEGYSKIGVMREVGEKFGKMLDVNIMQLILDKKI